MENKKLIILFAAGFSIVFSIVYFLLFATISEPSTKDKRVLYMNQVGLYKQQDSISDMQAKLKKQGITTYTWKQGDITAVVCGVSLKEAETKKLQETLKKQKYSYIQKSVSVTDRDVAQLLDREEYQKALERISK